MKRIAVVGSGISGLSSAYWLSQVATVDLYESEPRIGGHTHTVTVTDAQVGALPIDTGFIVFNEKNYPHFVSFLNQLGVAYHNSDMSFSYTNLDARRFWGSDVPLAFWRHGPKHWIGNTIGS